MIRPYLLYSKVAQTLKATKPPKRMMKLLYALSESPNRSKVPVMTSGRSNDRDPVPHIR